MLLDEVIGTRQLKRLDFTWSGRKLWDLFNQLAKQPPAPAPLAEEAKQQTFCRRKFSTKFSPTGGRPAGSPALQRRDLVTGAGLDIEANMVNLVAPTRREETYTQSIGLNVWVWLFQVFTCVIRSW